MFVRLYVLQEGIFKFNTKNNYKTSLLHEQDTGLTLIQQEKAGLRHPTFKLIDNNITPFEETFRFNAYKTICKRTSCFHCYRNKITSILILEIGK